MNRIKLYITAAVAAVSLAASATPAHAAPLRYCGTSSAAGYLGVVAIGPTSCAFARTTMITWWQNGRPSRVRVYSKVTHRWYSMRCGIEEFPGPDANPHGVCRGGNGAHAELRS
jgi:hypothetical protein